MSEPGCARRLSNGADVNLGRLIFSDPASASADERDFGIDGYAGTVQTSSRYYCSSFAADARSTA
jgi:hypothetical protein